MQKLISLLAVVTAALVMINVASAQHYKLAVCNAKQSAKTELSCAQRNIWHAQGTLRWIANQRSRTMTLAFEPSETLKLVQMQRNMTWLLRESQKDKAEADRRLVAVLPAVSDWFTAVRIVQRVFPGSEGWLMSCSSSEGGHGGWVPNRQGSGAGGWMQYMEGTFWGDYHGALNYALQHGFTVPASSASWYSALGQALAGGWAYYFNRPSGKWTGALC